MPKLSQTLHFAVGKQHLIYMWLPLLIALIWPASALAHGWGKPRLLHEAAGPFQVTVWVLPEPPRVDDLHISALAYAPEVTNRPVDAAPEDVSSVDLAVQIQLTSLVNPKRQMTQQTTRQVTFFQTYYESDFTLPSAGPWQVDVMVKGAAGTGSTHFILDVLSRPIVNWDLVFWGIILAFAVILAVRVTRTAS